MKKMLGDFKAFALKGNVVDLAVGVIIGAAFGKIVTSFVSDVLMPPLGLALGHVDFSDLFITLKGETFETLKQAKDAGAVTVNYGLFFNTCFQFLIQAIATFLLVTWMHRLHKAEPAPAPAKPAQEALLEEIRDLLKAQKESKS